MNEIDKIAMGNRIRNIRKKENVSQEVFGDRLGITKSSVSLLESGKNSPSDQTLMLLQSEYGVNVDFVLYGIGEPYKQLSNTESLMKYTALLLKDTDSVMASAIQALIVTYEQLDEGNKKLLEDIALRYIDNLKRAGSPSPFNVPNLDNIE